MNAVLFLSLLWTEYLSSCINSIIILSSCIIVLSAVLAGHTKLRPPLSRTVTDEQKQAIRQIATGGNIVAKGNYLNFVDCRVRGLELEGLSAD